MAIRNIPANCTVIIVDTIIVVSVDEECGSHVRSLQLIHNRRGVDVWAIVKCERNLVGANTTVDDCPINLSPFTVIMKW